MYYCLTAGVLVYLSFSKQKPRQQRKSEAETEKLPLVELLLCCASLMLYLYILCNLCERTRACREKNIFKNKRTLRIPYSTGYYSTSSILLDVYIYEDDH